MDVIYLLIKTIHGKLKIVSSQLRDFEEVSEVFEVFGRYDIVVKLVVSDKTELKKFMQNKLLILEGISSVESLIAV